VAKTVAEALTEDGFDCARINARFAAPIDSGVTEFYAQSADLIVTLEDHVLTGGYGSAVLEFIAEGELPAKVLRIAWPDKFIEHGSTVNALRERYGLTEPQIADRVRERLTEAREPAALVEAETAG